MFKGLGNLAQLPALFRQAQQLGSRMQSLAAELKEKRVVGMSGGGMVRVEANGTGDILSCRVDPSLFRGDDRELVEDLVVAATNEALTRSKELYAQEMKSLTEGMELPGLGDMLSQFTGGGPSSSPGGGPPSSLGGGPPSSLGGGTAE